MLTIAAFFVLSTCCAFFANRVDHLNLATLASRLHLARDGRFWLSSVYPSFNNHTPVYIQALLALQDRINQSRRLNSGLDREFYNGIGMTDREIHQYNRCAEVQNGFDLPMHDVLQVILAMRDQNGLADLVNHFYPSINGFKFQSYMRHWNMNSAWEVALAMSQLNYWPTSDFAFVPNTFEPPVLNYGIDFAHTTFIDLCFDRLARHVHSVFYAIMTLTPWMTELKSFYYLSFILSVMPTAPSEARSNRDSMIAAFRLAIKFSKYDSYMAHLQRDDGSHLETWLIRELANVSYDSCFCKFLIDDMASNIQHSITLNLPLRLSMQPQIQIVRLPMETWSILVDAIQCNPLWMHQFAIQPNHTCVLFFHLMQQFYAASSSRISRRFRHLLRESVLTNINWMLNPYFHIIAAIPELRFLSNTVCSRFAAYTIMTDLVHAWKPIKGCFHLQFGNALPSKVPLNSVQAVATTYTTSNLTHLLDSFYYANRGISLETSMSFLQAVHHLFAVAMSDWYHSSNSWSCSFIALTHDTISQLNHAITAFPELSSLPDLISLVMLYFDFKSRNIEASTDSYILSLPTFVDSNVVSLFLSLKCRNRPVMFVDIVEIELAINAHLNNPSRSILEHLFDNLAHQLSNSEVSERLQSRLYNNALIAEWAIRRMDVNSFIQTLQVAI